VKTVARPIGVTIIAILGAIGTALSIIGGVIFLALGPLFASFGIPFVTALGVLAGVIFLVFGLIGFAIAWGLWKGKNWARWITIIGAAIGVLLGVLSIVQGSLEGGLVGVIIDALFIYILMRPDAKAFFGGPSLPTYGPSPPAYAPAPAYTAPPTPPPPPQSPFCATCGKRTTYIQQYQRHYCYNCQKYV